jgi:hypothetical protein
MATISLDIQLSNPAVPQLKPMTATALVDTGTTTPGPGVQSGALYLV